MAERPYIAITLFEFSSDAEGYVPLYREDVTLVYAASEAEARELVETSSRYEEGTHQNKAGDIITLTRKAVIDVSAALTEDLSAGGDLYARHFRDIAAYAKMETLLDE
ncbi:DUF4288 domain-containing protein [Nocardia sp. NPDC003963]